MKTILTIMLMCLGVGFLPAQNTGCNASATLSVVIMDCTSSTEISALEQVKITPNPNDGIFELSFVCNSLSDIHITITDLNGRNVFDDVNSLKHCIGNIKMPIYLSCQTAGVYILSLSSGNQVTTQRLVIH